MAKNDFSAEAAENYAAKCLCVLVLDVSGSMNIKIGNKTLIDELNSGLQAFYEEISNDVTTSQQLEVSIITFNDSVETVVEPALIENITIPHLTAESTTAMVDAVYEAIEKIDARKQWYKETGQPYYRPWIILITDGEPDDGQDVIGLGERIKEDMRNKKYVFMPLGVQGADMDMLRQLCGELDGKKITPQPLDGQKFSSFFKWLSASMGSVIIKNNGGGENENKQIPSPSDWLRDFVTIG
ncbi:vWA domain-containing protein [Capnocytophaga leadbetteri]